MKLKKVSVLAITVLTLIAGYVNRERFGIKSVFAKKKEHCMTLAGLEKRDCFNSLFSEMGLTREESGSYFNYDVSTGKVDPVSITEENNFKKVIKSSIKNLSADSETCAYNGFAFDMDKDSLFISSEQAPKVVVCFSPSGEASNVLFSESFGIINVYKLLNSKNQNQQNDQG